MGNDALSIGTIARKRRRQILQSHRAKTSEGPTAKKSWKPNPSSIESTTSVPTFPPLCPEPNALSIVEDKVKVVQASDGEASSKKSQMRYDPKVPMTKEDTTAWRREQRRKRNRESAAASRQRQRDRISELEEEVTDWKSKYEEAMTRIAKLEKMQDQTVMPLSGLPDYTTSSIIPAQPEGRVITTVVAVSPCPSPPLSPTSPHLLSPLTPIILDRESQYRGGTCIEQDQQAEAKEHLIEISRQA